MPNLKGGLQSNVSTFGSYRFGAFAENQRELSRLKHQASILSEKELAFLRTNISIDSRVLDLGSGPGIISTLIAQQLRPTSVIGVDVNHACVEEAQSLQKQLGLPNLQFIHGSAYDLSQFRDSFDFAYCRFLFQHLSSPLTALRSIRSALAPGGKVCILDVDDGFLALHPGGDRLDAFLEKAREVQASFGGDRFVGRKLYQYLQQAGFSSISVEVHMISSQIVPLRDLFHVVLGFKQQLLLQAEAQELAKLADEIIEEVDASESWAALGLCVATGRRTID
jgi:ubiquinone/menaquinone biosynthesis C-methylase UbiE